MTSSAWYRALGACLIISIQPAWAHHSGAMFEPVKEITVQGVVKEFQYTNPHSWLVVVARDPSGKEVEWSFEAEGPSSLMRVGIRRSSLQPGDKVSILTHPMKDGRPGGAWITATKADGTVLSPHGAPPPNAGDSPK